VDLLAAAAIIELQAEHELIDLRHDIAVGDAREFHSRLASMGGCGCSSCGDRD
jgi:hypothetical protein